MEISISNKGDFSKTYNFLKKAKQSKKEILKVLEKYGQRGIEALEQATPKRTGKTAASWSYQITKTRSSVSIVWTNSNTNKSIPIVMLIQYGHALPQGGYVEGIDFINPAMKPIFDEMANEAWQEVNSE